MRLPIALGLGWPDRVPGAAPGCDWTTAATWEFLPLDEEAFPAVSLARAAGLAGGSAPAVYNAANETCVEAFIGGRLRFTGILDTLAQVLDEHEVRNLSTVADVVDAETWARARATELTSGEQHR
jgi:1-deoxy-D-xylulose-5-phosphate reductoisomerase